MERFAAACIITTVYVTTLVVIVMAFSGDPYYFKRLANGLMTLGFATSSVFLFVVKPTDR
jgi:hypothetical protein